MRKALLLMISVFIFNISTCFAYEEIRTGVTWRKFSKSQKEAYVLGITDGIVMFTANQKNKSEQEIKREIRIFMLEHLPQFTFAIIIKKMDKYYSRKGSLYIPIAMALSDVAHNKRTEFQKDGGVIVWDE